MKNKLIEDNMNLVYFLVKRYYPTYIGNEDVIQEGMVGLCNAAMTYDESKSKFSSYASYCILNQIRHYFNKNNKHNNHFSLDYEVRLDDGSQCSMGDMLIGEMDVDFGDIVFTEFYQRLSDKDKELVDLCRHYTQAEIARMWGVSRQSVNQKVRKIYRRWERLYGSKSKVSR